MPKPRRKLTYHVQLARLRLDTTVVTIEIDHHDDDLAADAALTRVDALPATAWRAQPVTSTDYAPFVQAVIPQDELKHPTDDERDIEAQIEDEAEIRYILLKANCGTGEGDVVLQPWLLTDQPDLMASDLTRDWIASLEHLGLTHLSKRLDELPAGAKPNIGDAILFGARIPRGRKPKRKT